MNISFGKLAEEECECCDIHKQHLEDSHQITKSKGKDRNSRAECTEINNLNTPINDSQTIENCNSSESFEDHLRAVKESG